VLPLLGPFSHGFSMSTLILSFSHTHTCWLALWSKQPWGTGMGKRDGSQPLPSKFMAGVAQAFEYIDVMTSGKITAFASKNGLQDSLTVISEEFTVAGR
jgi:hypothetical protein